jgi:hypothetical protein
MVILNHFLISFHREASIKHVIPIFNWLYLCPIGKRMSFYLFSLLFFPLVLFYTFFFLLSKKVFLRRLFFLFLHTDQRSLPLFLCLSSSLNICSNFSFVLCNITISRLTSSNVTLIRFFSLPTCVIERLSQHP